MHGINNFKIITAQQANDCLQLTEHQAEVLETCAST